HGQLDDPAHRSALGASVSVGLARGRAGRGMAHHTRDGAATPHTRATSRHGTRGGGDEPPCPKGSPWAAIVIAAPSLHRLSTIQRQEGARLWVTETTCTMCAGHRVVPGCPTAQPQATIRLLAMPLGGAQDTPDKTIRD